MSDQNVHSDHQQIDAKGEKPWPIIIMVSMLASVIIAGLILAPRSDEQKLRWLEILGTTNHGEFINPPLDIPPGFFRQDGNPWARMDAPTWKLVVVNTDACTEQCMELIYLIRQVHTRLNRDSGRVDLGFANAGNSRLDLAAFKQSYPEVDLLDVEGLSTLFGGSNLLDYPDQPLVLLINPIDVAQIFYTLEHDGVGMLRDIDHLLDLSR